MPRTSTTPPLLSRPDAASTTNTRIEPGATPVSSPAPEMVATMGLVVPHVTGLVTLPLTENASVWPRMISPALGDTVIAGVGVTVMEPLAVVSGGVPSLNVKAPKLSPVEPPPTSAGLITKRRTHSVPEPASAADPAWLTLRWPAVTLNVASPQPALLTIVLLSTTAVAVATFAL